MNNDLERAVIFDLQFFAEETGGEPALEKTTSTPAQEPSAEVQTNPESEESFIDEDLLPKEVKEQDYFKGMKRAYTQKTQEIAEFKKVCKELGMTPQIAAKTLNEVNQMVANVKSISESQGEEAAIDYLARSLGITRKQAQKLTGNDQPQADDDPFANDDYAQALRKKIKEEAVKEAEERLAEKYGKIIEQFESAQAQQFKAEVDKAISKVMDDFKGLLPANVTHEVLFNCAQANKIDLKQMEAALMMTLGPAEYNKLIEKKTIQNLHKNAEENKKSVGPVMSAASGNTPKTGEPIPNDFGQAKKEILSIFRTLKNSS